MQRRGFLELLGGFSVLPALAQAQADAASTTFAMPNGRTFGDAVNGVGVRPNGNLLVAHTGGVAGAAEFSPEGKFIHDWAPQFAGQGQGVLSFKEEVWVLGHGPEKIGGLARFSGDGSFVGAWLGGHLTSMARTSTGRVFVAQAAPDNHGILELDCSQPEPETSHRFGEMGREVGQLRYPRGLFVDEEKKRLGVCDFSNRRHCWFDWDGNFLKATPCALPPLQIFPGETALMWSPGASNAEVHWLGARWAARSLPGQIERLAN